MKGKHPSIIKNVFPVIQGFQKINHQHAKRNQRLKTKEIKTGKRIKEPIKIVKINEEKIIETGVMARLYNC